MIEGRNPDMPGEFCLGKLIQRNIMYCVRGNDMKQLISKMNVCRCLAILLVVALLAVGKAYFFPGRINPILLERIKADYAAYYGAKKGPEIQYCYGIYNGCVPVIFHHAGYVTTLLTFLRFL